MRILVENKGISLMALVITIIVLLILAGVSINAVIGNNGVLSKATNTKELEKNSEAVENINEIFRLKALDKGEPSGDEYILEIMQENRDKFLDIKKIDENGDVIAVQWKEDQKWYKVENVEGLYKVTDVNINISANATTIKNVRISFDTDGGNRIESILLIPGQELENLPNAVKQGFRFVGWYTEQGVEVTAATKAPENDTTYYAHWNEVGPVTFSTKYGRIDVIWLSGTGNTVTSTPNVPNLSGMTPVSWTKNGDTWTEDTTASESYYNYIAGTGTGDNLESRWANAKNSDGSYFVWIPRFAYRITYYASETSTEPTGYYDGLGQWRAADGSVRLPLDSGIETVEHDGKKYIVHPAFCGESVGYDNGSWSNNISGFWVAKYEMSREGATASDGGRGYRYSTKFKSIPSVQAAQTHITIGNMYEASRNYDSSKESHLIKNSEWGAVTYLAYSQYGRNGNDIDINNSKSYITGNGGGTPNAGGQSGIIHAYNTIIGAKASTTGNVYGVYDLSGGCYEYVAAFNNPDLKNYGSKYGSSFAMTSNSSDKYITRYYNETSDYSGNAIIYKYGKIGDATKEVNRGGEYDLDNTVMHSLNWFAGYTSLCFGNIPFIHRGGVAGIRDLSGIFFICLDYGTGNNSTTFRVVLCP